MRISIDFMAFLGFFTKVDLEGFEPSSKRGTNLLSTCLSSLDFSTQHLAEATLVELILLISSEDQDLLRTISDIAAPPVRIASKPELPGDVSFRFLEPE